MENNVLTDHAYDGIQEFDNPLPGWWKWMFIGSIVFSVFYAMYFHIGAPGRSIADQYAIAFAANASLQFKEIGDLEPTPETILLYRTDLVDKRDGLLSMGETYFKSNCISCHGRDGEGKVGPNLKDSFYKNVRKVEDIARVISNGAGNGAMPAWSNRLQPNEIVLVSAYVASLRGTAAAGEGKDAEGSEIPPWPEPSEFDEKAVADEQSAAGEQSAVGEQSDAATATEPDSQGEPETAGEKAKSG